MYEENEEFEREMNYKSPSQVIGDSVAKEFADGQEETLKVVREIIGIDCAKYITVLDFEVGKVFQYDIGEKKNWNPENESCEEFLSDVGHNLTNCEWMVHDSSEVITP